LLDLQEVDARSADHAEEDKRLGKVRDINALDIDQTE
jgi:hypothetical protein